MHGKYEILVNILDKIRDEANGTKYSRYLPLPSNVEAIGNARSRAFIHLYLKVMFGIMEFSDRERWITDDANDGGIDAYYIDAETKTIHIVQSKFRANSKNFESKEIELAEILKMDIDRILGGEEEDEIGNSYNGKIKQLQREVAEINDIARYRYRVVILANLSGLSASKVRVLTGGYAAEVFDFQKSYEMLVLPVISGTYFAASEIIIPFDITHKSAGAKISYTVSTKASDCEITVLFVPAIEIAKVMSKYKNSILQYNPRSYLILEGQQVNSAIRSTITESKTNELALFNNGITIISDQTDISERVGQRHKAQLLITNPQIINGGQTSYVLSKIYEDCKAAGNGSSADYSVFEDKEILVKVITLSDNGDPASKQFLIDEISNATNKQTPVIAADKLANDATHKQIQKILFERCGLLYERKRGEFADGLANGYISSSQIIERNHFFRLFYSVIGRIEFSSQKRLFQKNDLTGLNMDDDSLIYRIAMANHLYNLVKPKNKVASKTRINHFAKIHIGVELYGDRPIDSIGSDEANTLNAIWNDFSMGMGARHPSFVVKSKRRWINGEPAEAFNYRLYYKNNAFAADVAKVVADFRSGKIRLEEAPTEESVVT